MIAVIETIVEAGRVRVLIGHQAVVALQPFHGHAVGDQENVGLGTTGGELGLELGHHLGGAVAHPFHLDVRMGLFESVDRLLGVLIGLAGIKDELAVLGHGGSGLDADAKDSGCQQAGQA